MKRRSLSKIIAFILLIVFLGMIINPSVNAYIRRNFTYEKTTLLKYNGKILYVDDDNTEGPWDGSLEHPFMCIEWGLNAAKEGDTVFVFNGSYHEHIIINKSINLQGENKNSTTLTGQLKIRADNTTIKEFNFKCLVAFFDSNYNTFENNIVRNSKIGIQIYKNCQFNTISKNIIYNHRDRGILIVGTSNNVICNNRIYDNKYGISFWDESKWNKVSNNLIYNNECGIELTLLIYEKSYNSISSNTIRGNLKGIYIRGKGNIITKNNFENNKYYHANFTYFDESSPNKNNFANNYWDDWCGFGPYRIVGEWIYYDVGGQKKSIPFTEYDWFPSKDPHKDSKEIGFERKRNVRAHPVSLGNNLQKILNFSVSPVNSLLLLLVHTIPEYKPA